MLPTEAPEAFVQGAEGFGHAAAPQAPAVLPGPGAEVLQGLQEPLAVGGPRLQLSADGLHDLPNGALGRYLLILLKCTYTAAFAHIVFNGTRLFLFLTALTLLRCLLKVFGADLRYTGM